MNKLITINKYSCLMFGEGGSDRKFLISLTELKQFQYHTANWVFHYSNGSGGSPACILGKCEKHDPNRAYDLVMCFIDLDKLKDDYPSKWQDEKTKLEERYSQIHIIWHLDNLEDVLKKTLGKHSLRKHSIHVLAKQEISKFINSELWNEIVQIIKKEEELKTAEAKLA